MRSWAAGFFEGEGSIAITRTRGRSGNWAYHLACAVTNGDLEPLERLRSSWGGYVYSVPVKGDRRPMFVWRCQSSVAAAFLADIHPWIASTRVSRKAEIAVEFQAQKSTAAINRTPAYVATQIGYFDQMRDLNLRGRKSIDRDVERPAEVAA